MGRSALKRDWVGMGLSAAGLIPGIGNAATTAKTARKGVKAIAHGADAARTAARAADAARTADRAADAARVVDPDSIGWFKNPSGPRAGTFADEVADAKDVVFTRVPGEMVVRNPNLPVPSKAGELTTVIRNPNLPARTGDLIPVGPSANTGGWRKHLGKYGAGAAALLGLGLLTRDDDESEVSPETAPVVEGGEVVSPVVQPVTPVQPATPVYVPIESNQSQNENVPAQTVVEQPENKIERPLDKFPSQFYNAPNKPSVPTQPEVTVISDRLAKRLDKYNRINRYGNFVKDRQEEHPDSRYLNRVERRADRKEERAYNRLSKLAAKQGVNFGINPDEFAYVKPATPTYVGPYNKQ